MTGISGLQASGYTTSVISEKNADAKTRISFENALAAAGAVRFEKAEMPSAEMPRQSPMAISAHAPEKPRLAPAQQVIKGLYKLMQSKGIDVKPSLDIRQ